MEAGVNPPRPTFVTHALYAALRCAVQAVVDLVREYNALGRGNLAIMLDTKGPGELPRGCAAQPAPSCCGS